jgi:hypothetical protein
MTGLAGNPEGASAQSQEVKGESDEKHRGDDEAFEKIVIAIALECSSAPTRDDSGELVARDLSKLTKLAEKFPADLARVIATLAEKPEKPSPRFHLLIWGLAAIIAGLFPIGLAAAVTAAEHSQDLGFYQMMSNGDLFAISAVLAFAGLGELFLLAWHIPKNRAGLIALTGIGMAILAAADSALYGISSSRFEEGAQAGNAWITYGSLAMFALAAALTSSAAWTTGESEA